MNIECRYCKETRNLGLGNNCYECLKPKKVKEMTKIPFNLERALAGDLCVDEDGVEYKLVHNSPNNIKNTLLFIKNYGTNYECSHWCRNSGSPHMFGIPPMDGKQLYMKPKKKTYWANVIRTDLSPTGIHLCSIKSSWEEAIDSCPGELVKTISFEVEE